MELTEDSYRALAQSSPWRWTVLHATRHDSYGTTGFRMERPGVLRILRPGREDVVETGPAYGPLPAGVARWPHLVEPVRRTDGLVAERPDDHLVDYGEPIHTDYTWTAMLDPVELSHHTVLSDLREENRAGRRTWWARVVSVEGYAPTCGCCPLLWSEVSDRDERDGDPTWQAPPAGTYPEAHEVALDLEAGVVVDLFPIGGGRPSDRRFTLDLHRVD